MTLQCLVVVLTFWKMYLMICVWISHSCDAYGWVLGEYKGLKL